MRRLSVLGHAAFLVAASALSLAAQASLLGRPVQFHNPDWSPTGREVLFESTLRGGRSSIFVVRSDGTALRPLTPDSIEAQQGRWSPDGRDVLYSARARGRSNLEVVAVDGSGGRPLTHGEAGERFFASYSPDGRWIAFQLNPTPGAVRSMVYVMRDDGSELRQVSDSAREAEAPTWRPGTRQLVFRQVAYPRRRWAELGPDDTRRAQATATVVAIQVDDPSARARPTPRTPDPLQAFADSSGAEGVRPSPDGQLLAYTKLVDGWMGVYVYDRSRREERRLAGGAGAGPLGYLRVAVLRPGSDTIETYTSAREAAAPLQSSRTSFVRTMRRVAGVAWELTDAWRDSSGVVTTTQQSRTGRGTLAIERESVRSRLDSASLLVVGERATGWVVPEGGPARLVDYPSVPPLFSRPMVAAAIAAARPSVGATFVAPVHTLFSPAGLTEAVDTILVLRRDSVVHAAGLRGLLVLQHSDGQQSWVDETTGHTVIARGAAGPTRWWWHVARGLELPRVPSP